GRYILDINDPDFPEQYQRLLARLDYLTKLDTKASGQRNFGYSAYSALFDHGLASKSDQRFASIRSTGNLTFSTAF
ncbi:YagK/YfjJ domain-containing protein, partial [Escherichia coli]|uniref:YagK/YfjJ domain-containing protein n=1 Tax=Escherichia coli TaxID=562 RepID=UPI00202BBAB1